MWLCKMRLSAECWVQGWRLHGLQLRTVVSQLYRVMPQNSAVVRSILYQTRMEGKAQRVAARALSPTRDN